MSTAAGRDEILRLRRKAPASPWLEDIAAILRALGDPTRLAIAALLFATEGELCVCHLEARFDLAQPTISHHLKVLRELALVTATRRATWIHYAIDRERVASVPGLAALLGGLAREVTRPKRACCP